MNAKLKNFTVKFNATQACPRLCIEVYGKCLLFYLTKQAALSLNFDIHAY